MKRYLPWLFLGLLAGSLVFTVLRRPAPSSALEGRPMPTLVVQDFAGRKQTLDTWRGKVTVVNVWASWCPPCITEMPSLQRLHEQLGGEGLVVMGVSVDEGVAEAQEILRRTKVGYPNVHDPDGHRVLMALDIEGLPTTFVVGQDGTVLEVFAGVAEYDTPRAVDYFRRLLRR